MPPTVWTSAGEGSLTGDVTAQRIAVGDGAFFKGGIDISKPNQVRRLDTQLAVDGMQEPSMVGSSRGASELDVLLALRRGPDDFELGLRGGDQ